MGIINWLMHRGIQGRAQELAEWAMESYKSVRSANADASERDVFKKMLNQRVKFPGGEQDLEKVLDRWGSSLHGLCYYLGLHSQEMKGMMVSRCIQFTEYVDLSLKERGAKPLPPELKKEYFRILHFPEESIV